MKNKNILIAAGVFVALFSLWLLPRAIPAKLDAFAQCLKEKGAVFYGAFWCPHCQNQKRLFGRSQKHLPYVECSTPDGKNQTAFCREKRIEGYPTWEFSGNTRESGELTLAELSSKTGCALPK